MTQLQEDLLALRARWLKDEDKYMHYAAAQVCKGNLGRFNELMYALNMADAHEVYRQKVTAQINKAIEGAKG